jgi:hypothetical protein
MHTFSTWIMIAGPYSSGAANDEERQKNLDVLNKAALELFKRGYLPIIGVNNALPLIHIANTPEAFEHIMMPYSLALSERCDACLRIGGPSKGADDEVARFRAANKPVYSALEEVPALS